MPRWTPADNAPLGPNERIGRRLFDEPALSGAPDQPLWRGLDVRHFEETRDRQFSVDRLGATGIDGRVKSYLVRRALEDAKNYHEPKGFNGWVHMTVRNLHETEQESEGIQWAIEPSPITGDDKITAKDCEWTDSNLAQNRYHAHVVMPEQLSSYLFALCIRQKFVKDGDICKVPSPQPRTPDTRPTEIGEPGTDDTGSGTA